MKIIKYSKLKNNKYEIILDNNEKIKLYEDIILKENLLWKKEINDIDDILKKNKDYEIYDVALKRISNHVESIKGMEKYLIKKGYSSNSIKETIDKLVSKGYLNNDYYAKCYINEHINLSNDGPLKIKKHLMDLDINPDNYKELNINNDIWKEKIKKYIEKQVKLNKKSLYIFKNKILINLMNLGYEKELINECLSNITITNQDELRKKEEEKIRKKLEKKYEGYELERKIKEKLYQKGFFE